MTAQANPTYESLPDELSVMGSQMLIENASLEGIVSIFGEYICNIIRRVTVQTKNMAVCKGSVTAVISPWDGPVDCLLSLEVCEWSVEYLAMALFNAKVAWVEQAKHIGFSDGTTLVIPHPEATLRGARDEAITTVFGLQIHNAINDSSIRRRELQEGKQVTECVSMILMENGAIINLSLGLDRGLEIIKKLYP